LKIRTGGVYIYRAETRTSACAKARFAGRRLLHRHGASALAAAKRFRTGGICCDSCGGSAADVLAHVLVAILLRIVVEDANVAFANAESVVISVENAFDVRAAGGRGCAAFA